MSLGYTTINVHQVTKDRLAKIGKFGESYEQIINRLLDGLSVN